MRLDWTGILLICFSITTSLKNPTHWGDSADAEFPEAEWHAYLGKVSHCCLAPLCISCTGPLSYCCFTLDLRLGQVLVSQNPTCTGLKTEDPAQITRKATGRYMIKRVSAPWFGDINSPKMASAIKDSIAAQSGPWTGTASTLILLIWPMLGTKTTHGGRSLQ